MFKTCKRKFKYRYIDKIKPSTQSSSKYLSFGQSIHKTLSKFNKITDKNIKTLNNLHNLLRSNWIREGYRDKDEERDFGLKALKILTNYFNNPLDKHKKVLITEKMIYKDMGEFILCGIIDKGFLRSDNKLEITDYKTGGIVTHSNDFQIDLQLPIYVLLAEEYLSKYPSIVSYYYLLHNKKIDREINNENINAIIEALWKRFNEIKNKNTFPCNPNEYCLSSCEYSSICEEATNENAIIANELENLDTSKYLF
ncbi:MAG: PD-(D/E)XK nuclease family protein [Firmicutes bacterium]|nr:PD-(D/E)XK nuclease family protein [Bacillota bacterium]